MEYIGNNIQLRIEKDVFEIKKNKKIWKSDASFKGKILLQSGREILFEQAKQIEEIFYENEIGFYALTRYRDLKGVNFAFDTLVWVEKYTGDIYFEWIPINDNGFEIKEIVWPAGIVEEKGTPILPVKEKGFFNTKEVNVNVLAHMDEDKNAYMVMNESNWDAYYTYDSTIQMHWLPSLGKMQYKRKLRYVFLENVEKEEIYNWYKQYEEEKGIVVKEQKTIVEKIDTLFLPNSKTHIQNSDGSIDEKVVCDRMLLPYIKTRSYNNILDVSALVETSLHECIHPHHKMTRKDCMEERIAVLKYLKAQGKVLVSKKCTIWAYPYIDVILEEKGIFADIFL